MVSAEDKKREGPKVHPFPSNMEVITKVHDSTAKQSVLRHDTQKVSSNMVNWSGGANQDNFTIVLFWRELSNLLPTHQGSAAMGSMHHSPAITRNKNLPWPGIAQILSSHCLDYKFLQKWEFWKNLRSDDFHWGQEQVSALITSVVSDQLWR